MPVTDADILWLDPDAEPAPAQQHHAAPPAAPAVAPPRPVAAGISLGQLIAAAVAMEWHDAVAIVSQLVDELAADRSRPPTGALPSPDAIRLDPDGRIDVRLVPNGPELLTAGIGRLLQQLLQDKPTPANLRLFAWRITADAGASLTLEEIADELGRWERPGRSGKLSSLYERARAAGPAVPAKRLPPPVDPPPAIVVPPPAAAASAVPEPARRPVRVAALIGAAAVACVGIGGVGAWLLLRPAANVPQPATAAAPAVTAAEPKDPAVDARKGRRATRPASPQPSRAATPRVPDRTTARDSQTDSTIGNVAAPRRPTPPASELPAIAPSPNYSVAPPPAQTSATPAPVASSADRRLYFSGDAGVTDAILVKPYLPPRPHPDIPDSALGVLEVVVDARGLVESVHLKSPANRYREKWWLFTAKDWRFEPARKGGVPVRFLKRIPLTDLNITEPQ
jgi:hypothetical protein